MSYSSLTIQHCICRDSSWKISWTAQKKISIGKKKEKGLHNSLTYPNLNMLSGLPKSTELQECLTTLKRVRNVHNMLSGSSYAIDPRRSCHPSTSFFSDPKIPNWIKCSYAIDPRRSCHPSTSSSRIQRFLTESNVVIWRLLDIWNLKMVAVYLNIWFGLKEMLFFF